MELCDNDTAYKVFDDFKIWIVNNKTDGILCVPQRCRVSVIHVSDEEDGEKRMAAINALNSQCKKTLSTHESIYAYTRPLDCHEGQVPIVPPNSGRNSRASPECILLEESIYVVIPHLVRSSVKKCIEQHDLNLLYISFMSDDQTCSTQCSMSRRQISGTIVIKKSEFGVLDVDPLEEPKSPLAKLVL
tara:strand:+ start:180 stop:743 length:564 start_codon:yes stop_codon:yes gene_type:complete